jgi:hypothetical protein
MNRHRYVLLFLLATSLLLSLMYIPPFNEISGDKEIYRYVGLLMHKGGVPYRDVFDHKPPLIFFLNYAGVSMNGWGQWLIDAALALLATAFLYRAGRKAGLPLAWLPPLLFNLMVRDYLLCLGMGMTREYTAMLMVLFFCIFMGRHRLRYFGLGAMAGLIFFMQQDQVLQLLPFFLYTFLWGEDDLSAGGRILRTAGGGAAIFLPLLLYFAVNNALGVAWHDAFLFNFGWYTTTLKESFFQHVIKLKTLMDRGNYELAFLVPVTLGVAAAFFPAANRRLIIAALAAVGLSIATEFMGGRDVVPQIYRITFTHYVLPLSGSIPVLLFCVFAFTREPVLSGARAQGIFAFLICVSLCWSAVQHGTHLSSNLKDDVPRSQELSYLRQQRPGDYQFYVFGSTNHVYINNELKILAPSVWVYQHFWTLYTGWDADRQLLHGIEQDLLRHRTQYVLDLSFTPDWFRDPAADADWHGFLQAHYQQVLVNKDDGTILWKRKEAS